jgi:hypothetical protein
LKLVDLFATELQLNRWYAWKTDDGETGSVDEVQATDFPLPVNKLSLPQESPDLLKQKQPAAVMYCLDALKHFGKMGLEEVRQVAIEVAIVGQNGLDYASSEQKYALRTLPGKRFSGLHMMCLMFVAFKQIDPALDAGMDLHDAYREALTLYEAEQ